MITVSVDAYRAQLRLSNLPAKVRAALQVKRTALMLQLEAKAKGNAPVGPSNPTHTGGQLRRSIFSEATDTATTVEGKVATGADTPYARIQELGGKTKAHEIVARNGKALAFQMGGKTVFFRRVNHPGSNIEGQFYMKRAFDDMRQEIVAGLTAAARGAAKE